MVTLRVTTCHESFMWYFEISISGSEGIAYKYLVSRCIVWWPCCSVERDQLRILQEDIMKIFVRNFETVVHGDDV